MGTRCDCCGAAVGPNPVGLRYRGRESLFCSFGCAVVQAAPACAGCSAKVLGRGILVAERVYCSPGCRETALAAP